MLSWHAFSMVGWVTSSIAERRLNKGRNWPAFLGGRVPCENETNGTFLKRPPI